MRPTILVVCMALVCASGCDSASADNKTPDPAIGVWECPGTRPDSTAFVVYQAFSADGLMRHSSGSDLYGAGYSSRGTANGFWTSLGGGTYNFKAVELLYKNKDETVDLSGGATASPAGFRDVMVGRFYVDQTFVVRQDASGKDQLCSGNNASNETDPCPQAAVTKLRRVNLDGTATLPEGTRARVRCQRLEAAFPTIQ